MDKDKVQNTGDPRKPPSGWISTDCANQWLRDRGPERQPSPLHILIVEDEMLPAVMLEIAVMDAGHIAHKASRLSNAMELASAGPFDAAVLDVNLADELVFPLAALLRKRGVPFLFASGCGKAALPREYRDCAVLQKPYSLDDFDSALRAVLRGPNHGAG